MASAVERIAVHGLKSIRRPFPAHLRRTLDLPKSTPASTASAEKVQLNPFLPRYNTKTKRWAPPRFSLRQQADIVKAARLAEQLTGKPYTSLLPPGRKFNAVNAPRVAVPPVAAAAEPSTEPEPALAFEPITWHGKLPEKKVSPDVYGLYANRKRMFKGHKWERVRLSKQIRRTILMKDMPRRVRRYKSFYRRRKPNPLKPPRSAKAPKLPF